MSCGKTKINYYCWFFLQILLSLTQSFFRQSNRYCGHIPTKIIIANILVMVNIQQNKGRLSLIPYTLLSARRYIFTKSKTVGYCTQPFNPCLGCSLPSSNTSTFSNINAVMTINMISGHSTSSLCQIIINTWKLTINSKCIFHLYTLWGLK